MSFSRALENSARAFNMKYACNFDFASFNTTVEEFTFLRPNSGWIDVYKMMFNRMYKRTLELVGEGAVDNLDAEAMLDDFEYTLIRPYVSETENAIRHKPYVGLDRITRLEYLGQLTKEAPKNSVELYEEKYKRGELSRKQMRSVSLDGYTERKRCIEIVGYVQALEQANRGRSLLWRTFHPFKNSAEKRDALLMKRTFVEESQGGEAFYNEIAAAAYETFDGHRMANDRLETSMVRAKEELDRKQKMNDAMKNTSEA